MPSRPAAGSAGAPLAGPRVHRGGWVSHGLAALAVSALGLAVAGSVTLTTNAETVQQPSTRAALLPATSAPAGQTVPGAVPVTNGAEAAVTRSGNLGAFAAPPADVDSGTDKALQDAVVKERAAQRAEDLSKTAEDATRATRDAGSRARSQSLLATDRKVREKAVAIATERRQRAIALRAAAELARKRAEAAKAAQQTNEQNNEQTPSDPAPTVEPEETQDASSSRGGAEPVQGAVIGTPFGATGLWARYHTGLDFRAAQGTPIRAVTAGVVLYAGNSGNWSGNHVAIEHAGGITTMSSHMSSIAVSAGQQVRAGQIIGRVGATGRAFGAHLHFEVYPRGVKYGDIYRAVNPVPWLRANGVQVN